MPESVPETFVPEIMVAPRRPMPVLVLADTSASMAGAKIAALNAAVRELAGDLAALEDPRMDAFMGVIRFGQDHAQEALALSPASAASVPTFEVGGNTPMHLAFNLVREVLEEPNRLPTNAFLPTLVLVSDGHATPPESAYKALETLLDTPRAARAQRLALAIGEGADEEMLRRFVGNPEIPVFRATEVHKIKDFFRWVTFSVQLRSQSRRPDLLMIPPLDDLDLDDLVF